MINHNDLDRILHTVLPIDKDVAIKELDELLTYILGVDPSYYPNKIEIDKRELYNALLLGAKWITDKTKTEHF